MKRYPLKTILLATAIMCTMTGCQAGTTDILPLSGTMDEDFQPGPAPEAVVRSMQKGGIDYRYENILNDEENHVKVWSMMWIDKDEPSGYYGIVVERNGRRKLMPDIYHGKNPYAYYDPATQQLWLVCGAMEGTGVSTKKVFMLRFDNNGKAFEALSIDPYEMQQILLKRMGYTIDGEDITFYDYGRPLCTVTNTITEMGGFDSEQPLWIGEQLSYDVDADGLWLKVTPGVKFTTGLMLLYNDTPTIKAAITLGDGDCIKVGEMKSEK